MNKTKKVLLVQPPSRARTPRPPLGLMYISACLSRENIDNDIVDIKGKENTDVILDKILDRIKRSDTDIIGITCLVTEIEIVEGMVKRIRETKPEALIVLGGAQPTSHPEHFIEAKEYIDYFVIGEGEITFTEFVKTVRRSCDKNEIRQIKGLAWFNGSSVERSASRELIADLDTLPFPAYDKVDMSFYVRPTSWGIRPVLLSLFWIFSSRGCPYRCEYCVAHEIFGRGVRQRSTRNVISEIEYLRKNYNIDAIYFYDESFTVNAKRAVELCDEIQKRRFGIVFGCQTRVNLISEKIVESLKKANFLQLDFGIESGSDSVLKTIRKDITVDQIKKAVNLCKRHGIRTFANMMVNLPDETEEDLKKSINLMRELDCNVVIWNVTVPYPGTFLARKLLREDYRKLMGFPSGAAYALLEEKYKFAKYNFNLKKLVDELYDIFPHPRYFHVKISADYIRRWFLYVNFFFNRRYIMTILRSRRKLEYIKSLLFQTKYGY